MVILPLTALTADVSQEGFAQINCPNTIPDDVDGDGISNTLEENGIDINNDRNPEINLPDLGSKPDHKDIYLKIDYMKNHKPSQGALDNATEVFANAPVCNPDGKPGINLHIRVDNELSHTEATQILCEEKPDWYGFEVLKNKSLELKKHGLGPKAPDIVDAESRIYYHAIFIHDIAEHWHYLAGKLYPAGISGCADPPNRNLVVSLGGFQRTLGTDPNTGDVRSNVEYEAATLLHELGHTLGLGHGGNDFDAMPRPNYISIMNYNFQFPDIVGERPLNYSSCAMASLNESQLNEAQGIGSTCPPGLDTWIGWHNINGKTCPPDRLVPTPTGPLDWNMSDSIETSKHDIDCDKRHTLVSGFDDWSHLRYLLNSTTWKKPLHGSGLGGSLAPVTYTSERTAQSVLDNRISLLTDLNKTTDNLPPIVRDFLDSQIGVSNYTTATDIIIPNNATSGLVVHNASGSFGVQNVTTLTIPSNATTNLIVHNATGSFGIQGTANDTNLGNATDASLPVKSNISVNVIVDNATHANISNATGVIATNATGRLHY